jgi:NTE family protein
MKKNVALVLSGGGARGLAHIGVIKELENQGLTVSSIAGTSMGSMIGGIYALNQLEVFEDWILSLNPTEMLRQIDFAFGKPGLIEADKVLNTIKGFIADHPIEKLPLPYAAVAVDLVQKEEVVFTSGSLYDAIRASIAIPNVITPVNVNNKILVDGGVMNNIPVNHIKRTSNDFVIAVNVNAHVPINPTWTSTNNPSGSNHLSEIRERIKDFIPNKKKEQHGLGYFGIAGNTIRLMTNHIAQLQLALNPPDVLINVSRNIAETFDFHKATDIISYGKFCAKESIAKLDRKNLR